MPPRSSPSITSTTKRAKCLSGSHSSTDGGRRNAVRRSTSRKLLIAIKPPFGANQWRDSSENQRRWVKSDRLLEDAVLDGCRIYGISAWNVKLSEGTKQRDLVITPWDEPAVRVDDLEVAQFVYLLLHNEKIRKIIDTVGKKGVLLVGRFTEGRIVVLERLREELRKRDYVPIIFNFDKP